MNPLDIFIIIVFSYSLIRGIFRGLVKEISSIVGVLAGFYAAYTYYPFPARLLSRWISDPAYQRIIGFFIIFCLILIIVNILAVVITYILRIAYLGWIDRICGAGFGAVKAVLITGILIIALTAFLRKEAPIVRDSYLAPHVTVLSENMAKVVSKQMQDQYSENMIALKNVWKVRH